MKKLITPRTITIISFIAAIGGLISAIAPAINMGESGMLPWRSTLNALFYNVNFSFFDPGLLYYWYGEEYGTRVAINAANFLFYILFLAGAMVYTASGFRNTGIIAFCFSLVFFFGCTGTCFSIYYVVSDPQDIYRDTYGLLWWLFFLVCNLAWLGLSWAALKHLLAARKLIVVHYDDNGEPAASYRPAGRWTRFAHVITDRILVLLCFPALISGIFYDRELDNEWYNGDGGVIFVLIFCIVLYYSFFEGIFGITPAKLLTATRVTDELGNKPRFLSILGRTLSRLVPFDALSFFFERGWHDAWSDTYVLKDTADKRKANINVGKVTS